MFNMSHLIWFLAEAGTDREVLNSQNSEQLSNGFRDKELSEKPKNPEADRGKRSWFTRHACSNETIAWATASSALSKSIWADSRLRRFSTESGDKRPLLFEWNTSRIMHIYSIYNGSYNIYLKIFLELISYRRDDACWKFCHRIIAKTRRSVPPTRLKLKGIKEFSPL